MFGYEYLQQARITKIKRDTVMPQVTDCSYERSDQIKKRLLRLYPHTKRFVEYESSWRSTKWGLLTGLEQKFQRTVAMILIVLRIGGCQVRLRSRPMSTSTTIQSRRIIPRPFLMRPKRHRQRQPEWTNTGFSVEASTDMIYILHSGLLVSVPNTAAMPGPHAAAMTAQQAPQTVFSGV